MARIRSIHPGLFTDEAFVSVSMAARMLAIGIWTECDDQGAFEWKPVTLKMRLMAADNIDVAALLDELTAAEMVKPYSVGGRSYGLVRNFQKFQRPKKPNSTHPIPDEFRTYLGCAAKGSEPTEDEDGGSSPPVPHQFPTSGEKSPQMEDGGDNKEVSSELRSAAVAPIEASKPMPIRDQLWSEGLPLIVAMTGKPNAACRSLLGRWVKAARDDCARVLAILRQAEQDRPIDPIPWVERALASRMERKSAVDRIRDAHNIPNIFDTDSAKVSAFPTNVRSILA